MITQGDIIDDIWGLLNVEPVRTLAPKIFKEGISTGVFEGLKQSKACFIDINCLPLSFGQVQRCVVNVNLYAPNKANGLANTAQLNELLKVVYPLLEDQSTDHLLTTVEQVSKIPEENYHYYNVRVLVHAENINTTKI